MSTVVDLKPLMDNVVWPLVSALVPILASWIAYRIAALLKVKEQETVRPSVQQALESALALMKAQVPGSLSIDVKNERIAMGANYVIAQVPGALKTLGVSPNQVANKLRAEVEKAEQKPLPTATIDVTVDTKSPS